MNHIDHKKIDILIGSKYKSNKDFMTALNGLNTTIKEDAIKKWRQGNSTPKTNDLPNIAKALGVSIVDLYHDSDLLKEKIITDAIKNPSEKIKRYLTEAGYDSDRIREVVLHDGYVGAGSGGEIEGSISSFFIDKYIINRRYRDCNVSAIQVIGDSMTPYAPCGSLVLFVPIKYGDSLGDGKYIIDTIQGKMLKNLKFHIDGSITISSENSSYPSERINRESQESFKIIGLVVGRILKS